MYGDDDAVCSTHLLTIHFAAMASSRDMLFLILLAIISVFFIYSHFSSTNETINVVYSYDSAYLISFHHWLNLLNSTVPTKMEAILEKNAEHYRGAVPFPHMVADDVFPESILKEITSTEFLDHPTFAANTDCVQGGKCYRDSNQLGKSELSNPESVSYRNDE